MIPSPDAGQLVEAGSISTIHCCFWHLIRLLAGEHSATIRGHGAPMETTSDASSLLILWMAGGAILVLIVFSALFSGSETALTTASRGKLHALAENGDGGANRALQLTSDKERLIGAILLGNNLVNILATSLATMFFTVLLGDGGVAAATLVMTALVLIFAEVMPKTYAIANAETMASRVSGAIGMIVLLLAPIVNTVRALVRLILKSVGVETDAEATFHAAQEEIAGAITLHHFEGAVEKADRDLLLGALDLGQRQVKEVMMHRRNIKMIDADAPLSEVLAQTVSSPHTRTPIFRGEPENIIGVIHAKDLLRAMHKYLQVAKDGPDTLTDFDITDLAMKPYFVPESTYLDEQMREFQRRKVHFALVVNEYGTLQGLVTLEDILEEIVGDIADEHDTEEVDNSIKRHVDGSIEVEGSVTIRDINRFSEWNLPDNAASTVAGLVIHEAQAIPEEGDVFDFHGFQFEVLKRENNHLTMLRVSKQTMCSAG